jgi:hypothetical protein
VTGVVVIGAGVAGLEAAAGLSRAGLDVTVLEAQLTPGGCASTFSHQGDRFDAGATLAGGFYPGGLMDRVAQVSLVSTISARPGTRAVLRAGNERSPSSRIQPSIFGGNCMSTTPGLTMSANPRLPSSYRLPPKWHCPACGRPLAWSYRADRLLLTVLPAGSRLGWGAPDKPAVRHQPAPRPEPVIRGRFDLPRSVHCCSCAGWPARG